MRTQASAAGARGFVVALSGTVDAAVVARLAQLAIPGAVLGVLMPGEKDQGEDAYALLLAEHFSMPTVRLDLSPTSGRLLADLQELVELLPRDLREAARTAREEGGQAVPLVGVEPRLRMTALYFIAETLNCLLAAPGTRSEIAVGTFTKSGENSVDLLPLGHASRAEVIALARDLNIPAEIIARANEVSALPGSTTADGGSFTYADLQRYLEEGPQGVSP